jgi:hypothetical protein
MGACSTPILVTRLAAPLGNRRLVDATRSADTFGSILRPTTMAPYVHHTIDVATLSGVAASYTQLYGGPGVEMSIVETWGTTFPSGSNGLVVRGQPAVTWSGHLAWVENGTTVTIGSSTYGYLAPTTAQLMAIGRDAFVDATAVIHRRAAQGCVGPMVSTTLNAEGVWKTGVGGPRAGTDEPATTRRRFADADGGRRAVA